MLSWTETSLREKSAAACVDFGFAILEKLGGKELADKVKESVYYASSN